MNETEPALNRQERRLAKKVKIIKARAKDKFRKEGQPIYLRSLDGILEDIGEDPLALEGELANYEKALPHIQISGQYTRVLRSTGVTEETIRQMYIDQASSNYDPSEFSRRVGIEANPRAYLKALPILRLLRGKKGDRYVTATDEEEKKIWRELLEDRSIPLDELVAEDMRSTIETRDLLKLQLEWLVNQGSRAAFQLSNNVPSDEEDFSPAEASPEVQETASKSSEAPFLLQGWDVFWTEKHWSHELRYLKKISTSSRDEAMNQVEEVLNGHIAIKPTSVLRALEFHTSKDVLQRAMSARLKYVREDQKEWIKVKRGGDRIYIHMLQEGQLIFFAGNRDAIYRGI